MIPKRAQNERYHASAQAIRSTPKAPTLADEINIIIQTTVDFVYEQEAQVMEWLFQIRQEFADDDAFCQFIEAPPHLNRKTHKPRFNLEGVVQVTRP